jgi:ribosomal protein S18 acetylase RimI-like enzyme
VDPSVATRWNRCSTGAAAAIILIQIQNCWHVSMDRPGVVSASENQENNPIGLDLQLGLRPLGCTARVATREDEPFLKALTADRRVPEFRAAGVDDEILQSIVEMQYHAQSAAYASAYPGASHIIILRSSEPVGRLLTHQTHEQLHVIDIVLSSQAQGCGIGTAIIRTLQRRAESARISLRLSVAKGCPAQKLYERLGFKCVSVSEVDLVMEWQASGSETERPSLQ